MKDYILLIQLIEEMYKYKIAYQRFVLMRVCLIIIYCLIFITKGFPELILNVLFLLFYLSLFIISRETKKLIKKTNLKIKNIELDFTQSFYSTLNKTKIFLN